MELRPYLHFACNVQQHCRSFSLLIVWKLKWRLVCTGCFWSFASNLRMLRNLFTNFNKWGEGKKKGHEGYSGYKTFEYEHSIFICKHLGLLYLFKALNYVSLIAFLLVCCHFTLPLYVVKVERVISEKIGPPVKSLIQSKH